MKEFQLPSPKGAGLFLLTIILLFIMAGYLTSCMTPQKAKQYLKDKGELAQVCADEYPVKTEYIKGDSVVRFDTLFVGDDPVFDTVTSTIHDTVTRSITKTLPGKIITKTVVIVDTVVKENTAALEACRIAMNKAVTLCNELKDELQATSESRDEWKAKARKRWWFMWAILIACGAWTFRKTLLKLI